MTEVETVFTLIKFPIEFHVKTGFHSAQTSTNNFDN